MLCARKVAGFFNSSQHVHFGPWKKFSKRAIKIILKSNLIAFLCFFGIVPVLLCIVPVLRLLSFGQLRVHKEFCETIISMEAAIMINTSVVYHLADIFVMTTVFQSS